MVHNDDPSMRVLKLEREPGDERTGVFTSGIVSTGQGQKIALYFTGRQHAGENIADVLKRRAQDLSPVIQMCDALSRNVPKLPGGVEILVANCLAHYLDSGIIWSCLRQCPMQTAPDRRSLQIIPLMARPADPSNGYEPSDPLQRRPRASGGRVVAEEPPFSRVDDRLPAMDPALPYLLSTA